MYNFVRSFRIVLVGARSGHMDDLGSVRMVALFSVSPASFFVEFTVRIFLSGAGADHVCPTVREHPEGWQVQDASIPRGGSFDLFP